MASPGRDRGSRTASTRVVRAGEVAPETESPWDELSPGERTPESAERALAALRDFGAPLRDLTREDLTRPGRQARFRR